LGRGPYSYVDVVEIFTTVAKAQTGTVVRSHGSALRTTLVPKDWETMAEGKIEYSRKYK